MLLFINQKQNKENSLYTGTGWLGKQKISQNKSPIISVLFILRIKQRNQRLICIYFMIFIYVSCLSVR